MMNMLRLPRSKFPLVFDGTGKWKVDDAGNLVKDAAGNPIYINSANAEQSVKSDTIASLNAEARTHRERAEVAETKLKAFEGIADPAAAIAALETVSKIDQKKLIDAGEVDRVKADIAKQYDKKLGDAEKKATDLQGRLNATIVTNAFATSPYAKDKLAIPVDIAQSYFGARFEVNDKGQLVAKDASGNVLLSQKTMGEPAPFDEALELVIGTYPNKDSILKGDGHAGTGNGGAGGNTPPVAKQTMKRATFEQLTPEKRQSVAAQQMKGEVAIVD